MKFQGLLLLLALAVPAEIHAQDYSYTTNENNTLTITGYSGPGGAVNIPGAINGLPVTGIGTFAFLQAFNVNSVTIPEGVTSIGYDAFSGCIHLTSVLFPHSLTSLGFGAFSQCYSLGTILFPSGLTDLGGEVFYDCRSLTEVYFTGNAPTADSFYPFYADNATIYYRSNTAGWGPTFDGLPTAEWNPNDKLAYITNAGNTIIITGYTGPGGDVSIPAMIDGFNVAGIGTSAFSGVWSLTSVAITNGSPSIGSRVFVGCPNLSSVTIGDSVTNIAPDAFLGNNLTSIKVDPLNPDFSSLGGVLFDQSLTAILCCPNGIIGSYHIPDGVTRIGDDAFSGCFGLTNITIPATVARIGSSAFASCTGLPVISMPNTVTYIGDSAFSSCTGLTNITIPSAVNRIGSSAFANCTGLSAITIPDGVTCIASSEFSGCTGLTNVTVPASVTNIGAGAFSSCPSLTSIAVSDAVTTIGGAAFSWCSGLTNFNIGAGVTNIAAGAFAGCTSLPAFTVAALNSAYISLGGVLFNHSRTTLIAFPEAMGGSYAAMGGSYAIPGGVTTIGDFAFFWCYGLTNIVIPNGVTNIGNNALNGCSGLTSLTIPASVARIGDGAFAGLWSVPGIYFLGDAPAVGYQLLGDEFDESLYFLPRTSGWADFSDETGLPTAEWLPQIQSSGVSFGPATNLFGFNVAWASGLTIVVEACTNLANPEWQPLQTNTLTSGSADFSDPQWTNYASRFYRVRLQ